MLYVILCYIMLYYIILYYIILCIYYIFIFFSLQSKLIIKKQYNYMVCLSPQRNRSTCDIYTRTKFCLVIKSWDAFRNTGKQLFVEIWKDLLITVRLTATLTTQVGQKNLQSMMKETSYVQENFHWVLHCKKT